MRARMAGLQLQLVAVQYEGAFLVYLLLLGLGAGRSGLIQDLATASSAVLTAKFGANLPKLVPKNRGKI